jgi:hypothetical protein
MYQQCRQTEQYSSQGRQFNKCPNFMQAHDNLLVQQVILLHYKTKTSTVKYISN